MIIAGSFSDNFNNEVYVQYIRYGYTTEEKNCKLSSSLGKKNTARAIRSDLETDSLNISNLQTSSFAYLNKVIIKHKTAKSYQ